ncbi:MAG: endonuclease III domain-containing protein [Thermoplasmata archaeon]
MISSAISERIEKIFDNLLNYFGPQNWWPAETRYEVIVGSILTQNTSWKNVEKAIKNLKEKGILDIEKISEIDLRDLYELIKPSGFYKQKAERLKNISRRILIDFGNVENMMNYDLDYLYKYLISLKGIGEETAESILLYALDKKIFVVDSYTIRIFQRLGLPSKREEIKNHVIDTLREIDKLKEFHALLVELGKRYCKKEPKCEGCPLGDYCSFRKGVER